MNTTKVTNAAEPKVTLYDDVEVICIYNPNPDPKELEVAYTAFLQILAGIKAREDAESASHNLSASIDG